jgi:acetyl esterase/lipase
MALFSSLTSRRVVLSVLLFCLVSFALLSIRLYHHSFGSIHLTQPPEDRDAVVSPPPRPGIEDPVPLLLAPGPDPMAGFGEAPTSPGARPEVRLPQGRYVGEALGAGEKYPRAVDVWRGIPYARSRRFREATAVPLSDKTFDAVEFGDICPRAVRDPDFSASEDCLNLNVYRTRRPEQWRETKLLPVIVYVHGGAFNVGKATERDMASFVSFSETPIVGVNFNYRLGPLGFLPSSVTAREGVLNLGLRDQQAALEWVKANAKAFGGDPDNITLIGVSAGAHSVSCPCDYHAAHYGSVFSCRGDKLWQK